MTVSDASPLIALARIRAFALLEGLFTPLIIPPKVYHEVVTQGRGRPGDPEVQAAIQAGWMRCETPGALIPPPYGDMHAGEIETISLAMELDATVLMDEGPGRARAQREGLYVRGTLDVVLLAKSAGLITQVKPYLDALKTTHFHLDADLMIDVLRKAGENP